MTDATPRDHDEWIDVILPLRTRYASTLRVIAAALGADAGFTVDEIDDLRLGLNEVFSLLADGDAAGRVRATFRLAPGEVEARLAPESGPVEVEPDELATNILRSVVDRYAFEPDGVVLVKRAAEANGA
jgi:hypothetical protein